MLSMVLTAAEILSYCTATTGSQTCARTAVV